MAISEQPSVSYTSDSNCQFQPTNHRHNRLHSADVPLSNKQTNKQTLRQTEILLRTRASFPLFRSP